MYHQISPNLKMEIAGFFEMPIYFCKDPGCW